MTGGRGKTGEGWETGRLLRSYALPTHTHIHTLSVEILRAVKLYESERRKRGEKKGACHPQKKSVCSRARRAGSFSDTLSRENLITAFKTIHLILLPPPFTFKSLVYQIPPSSPKTGLIPKATCRRLSPPRPEKIFCVDFEIYFPSRGLARERSCS